MQLRRIVLAYRSRDAALGMPGVAVGNAALGENEDPALFPGQQRRKPGNATATMT